MNTSDQKFSEAVNENTEDINRANKNGDYYCLEGCIENLSTLKYQLIKEILIDFIKKNNIIKLEICYDKSKSKEDLNDFIVFDFKNLSYDKQFNYLKIRQQFSVH